MTDRPVVILFDVNETLLDLSVMRQALEEGIGGGSLLGDWFARMLHASLVATVVGEHQPFGVIGREQLVALAAKHGGKIGQDEATAVVDTIFVYRLIPTSQRASSG